jgi:cytochrome d ubiquinol oxidase subunit I
LNTRQYQPAKLAAIEGRWQTAAPAPLTLFGIPDAAQQRMDDAIEVPFLGSLILTHSLDGTVQGLSDFPADQRPPVWPVFFAFRLMVAIGFAMLGIVALGWWLRRRGRLFETAWFLRLCQLAAPLGFLAVLSGWTVTEVGRQPWTVYGALRTANSVTPSLTGSDVAWSLLAYMAIYLAMYPAGFAVMARMVRQGCAATEVPQPPVAGLQPQAPFATPAE